MALTGVFSPGGVPEMARERVRTIFGLKVPDRALYGLAGGLSTLQSGNRNEPLGGFFTGLGRGFAGAIGGAQAYAKHEEERQAQQAAAQRQAAQDALNQRNIESQIGHRAWQENKPPDTGSGIGSMTPEQFKTYLDRYRQLHPENTGGGLSSMTPEEFTVYLDRYRKLHGGEGGGRQMTAWQEAQIRSYMRKHPGASRDDAIAALTFEAPTNNRPVPGDFGATYFVLPDGTVVDDLSKLTPEQRAAAKVLQYDPKTGQLISGGVADPAGVRQ